MHSPFWYTYIMQTKIQSVFMVLQAEWQDFYNINYRNTLENVTNRLFCPWKIVILRVQTVSEYERKSRELLFTSPPLLPPSSLIAYTLRAAQTRLRLFTATDGNNILNNGWVQVEVSSWFPSSSLLPPSLSLSLSLQSFNADRHRSGRLQLRHGALRRLSDCEIDR